MIKAIIVDDERKSRELLQKLAMEFFPEQLMLSGMAANLTEAVKLVNDHDPALIFLDIELAGESGFDLFDKVQPGKFEVIFTTAFDRYAVKAFKYSAIDYLLKPIDPDEFKNSVLKVIKKKDAMPEMGNLRFFLENLGKQEEYQHKISLPTGQAYEVVYIRDIVRCEADGNYTTFYLTDKRSIFVSNGLKYYEDLLPSEHFVRVHNHHLLNLNHVVRYLKQDGGYAVMVDGSKVELSRRRKEFFLSKIHKI